MCADFVKLDLSRVSDVLCFLLRDGWIRYICLGGATNITHEAWGRCKKRDRV